MENGAASKKRNRNRNKNKGGAKANANSGEGSARDSLSESAVPDEVSKAGSNSARPANVNVAPPAAAAAGPNVNAAAPTSPAANVNAPKVNAAPPGIPAKVNDAPAAAAAKVVDEVAPKVNVAAPVTAPKVNAAVTAPKVNNAKASKEAAAPKVNDVAPVAAQPKVNQPVDVVPAAKSEEERKKELLKNLKADCPTFNVVELQEAERKYGKMMQEKRSSGKCQPPPPPPPPKSSESDDIDLFASDEDEQPRKAKSAKPKKQDLPKKGKTKSPQIIPANEDSGNAEVDGLAALAGSSDQDLGKKYNKLEGDYKTLKKVTDDLKNLVIRLEGRIDHLEKGSGGGAAKPAAGKVPAKSPAKPAAKDDDDDDVDLFGSGSDEEEEDAEKVRIRDERLKAYAEKKAKKPALIAKTSVLLDVKPWDDETDMDAMLKCCKTIQKDGLVWGASKLVPVGYGINKLQVMCVVEDEKVSIDELCEQITAFEEYVQSVDIAAMSKI